LRRRLGSFFDSRFRDAADPVFLAEVEAAARYPLGFLVAGYNDDGIGRVLEVGIPGPLNEPADIDTATLGRLLAWRNRCHPKTRQGIRHHRLHQSWPFSSGRISQSSRWDRVLAPIPSHHARRRRLGRVPDSNHHRHAAIQRRYRWCTWKKLRIAADSYGFSGSPGVVPNGSHKPTLSTPGAGVAEEGRSSR